MINLDKFGNVPTRTYVHDMRGKHVSVGDLVYYEQTGSFNNFSKPTLKLVCVTQIFVYEECVHFEYLNGKPGAFETSSGALRSLNLNKFRKLPKEYSINELPHEWVYELLSGKNIFNVKEFEALMI